MTRNRIAQMAQKYMEHDMIARHTDLPAFPDGRIRLLNAVLAHQPAAAPQRELFSLVTALVQMGLDTHDLVKNEAQDEKSGTIQMRARQLKVLAGDYFSSRFYNLLAQAGQIEMIRKLSEAVCDVNRIKIALYGKMKQMRLNAEEYLTHGAELRSGLFLSFGHLMNGLYSRLWPELLERFSRCEVLLHELLRLERPEQLNGSWGIWHILQEGSEEDRRALTDHPEDAGFVRQLIEKYAVADKLGGMLRQSAVQLQAMLPRVPSDKLAKELQALIEPFMKGTAMVPAAAIKELG
ncbi:heptaprenyl diphosphate synthase component 1 [Cohnella nanjingensis]|uniref:Heptaprenyl diphosphate synthase component 1 n=1 Tax=Cohnella nanjingensis TaxID=1387779 RepID=A0A7X0RX87_9BACL|nr:heptaprenyl diphosphate synthase component 1 [Cohnella nanjingensis]MBB6674146.1 heptaprenyl diphosphate synthase component 1 [Cohnella nanjingensis]